MSNPNEGGAGGPGARKPLTLNAGFTPFIPSVFAPSAPAAEAVGAVPPAPAAEPKQETVESVVEETAPVENNVQSAVDEPKNEVVEAAEVTSAESAPDVVEANDATTEASPEAADNTPVDVPAETQEEPAAVEEAAEENAGGDDVEGDEAEDEEGDDGEGPRKAVVDEREHLNLINIGHVDSGKSTLSGSLLYHSGHIDSRTIEKYEREAKVRNRDSWWLAFLLDTTEEERSKGITVEVGRATFATPNKRYTILDAPGHKSFVANMISGAAQADVAILVISARRGEFETGFEKGGQTREHALLAKTLGVRYLIVVVNKMDDATVQWDKGRFDEVVAKLSPYLKTCGYNLNRHVHFLPIAAIAGSNIKERLDKSVCSWYNGPSLLELLDSLSIGGRDPNAPLRIPILDKYTDRGVITMGKVEAGTIREGQDVLIMPQNVKAKVDKVLIEDVEFPLARPGENVKIRIRGCGEEDIMKGYVICDREKPVFATTTFECQLLITELDHRSLFTAGYSAILHIHTAEEEVQVVKLVAELDKRTGKPKPGGPPRFVKSGALCVCVLKTTRTIALDKYENAAQLGRFTLRDEGRTIGIGKVLRVGVPRNQKNTA